MNHDFICYIIISTIKIPHRLKNNFRYNYTVILYNNIIFRFSFQIRCSDAIHLAVGVRKYIFFCCKFHIDFFTQCYLFIFFFFGNTQRTHSKRHHETRRLFVFLLLPCYPVHLSFVLIHEVKRYPRLRSWCKGTRFEYLVLIVFYFF